HVQYSVDPIPIIARTNITSMRGIRFTVKPNVPGVEFIPAQETVTYDGDVIEVPFRFHAQEVESSRYRMAGTIDIYQESTLAGHVPVIFTFSSGGEAFQGQAFTRIKRNLYDTIFVSYSHDDEHVVDVLTSAYKAKGDTILRDKETIKSGEYWKEKIKRMIEMADVFQLYWSHRASESEYVAFEWEYALKIMNTKGEGFIRPLYWQKPMPDPPGKLNQIQFAEITIPF
nr:toll/interleukin-1 receptor domain-containing protein [Candidatus Sigynarchaeota archaeon]